jgi:hypothetical protein
MQSTSAQHRTDPDNAAAQPSPLSQFSRLSSLLDVANREHSKLNKLSISSLISPAQSRPASSTALIILHGSVAQKSYGMEKRFLTPPPLIHLAQRSNRPSRANAVNVAMAVTINRTRLLEQQNMTDLNGTAMFKFLHVASLGTDPSASSPSLPSSYTDYNAQQHQQNTRFTKSFHLEAMILASPPTPANATTAHSYPRSTTKQDTSQPPLAIIKSRPIAIISKPSKKTVKSRNFTTSGIRDGGLVCLFNRINSQTVRTRYLGTQSINDSAVAGLCVRTLRWAPFRVHVVSPSRLQMAEAYLNEVTTQEASEIDAMMESFVKALMYPSKQKRDTSSDTRPQFQEGYPTEWFHDMFNALEDDDLDRLSSKNQSVQAIMYGNVVVLEDLETGVYTPPLIMRKVEHGKVVLNDAVDGVTDDTAYAAGGPVTQMQKIALERYTPAFLSASKKAVYLCAGHDVSSTVASTLVGIQKSTWRQRVQEEETPSTDGEEESVVDSEEEDAVLAFRKRRKREQPSSSRNRSSSRRRANTVADVPMDISTAESSPIKPNAELRTLLPKRASVASVQVEQCIKTFPLMRNVLNFVDPLMHLHDSSAKVTTGSLNSSPLSASPVASPIVLNKQNNLGASRKPTIMYGTSVDDYLCWTIVGVNATVAHFTSMKDIEQSPVVYTITRLASTPVYGTQNGLLEMDVYDWAPGRIMMDDMEGTCVNVAPVHELTNDTANEYDAIKSRIRVSFDPMYQIVQYTQDDACLKADLCVTRHDGITFTVAKKGVSVKVVAFLE